MTQLALRIASLELMTTRTVFDGEHSCLSQYAFRQVQCHLLLMQ